MEENKVKDRNVFSCPNCDKEMHLDGCDNYLITDKDSKYDKWSCKNCSHIKVLNWRV